MNHAIYKLAVDHESLRSHRAHISITVPIDMNVFEAPEGYGGAPLFIQYLSDFHAIDTLGVSLPVTVQGACVTVATPKSTGNSLTLTYTYNVPQSKAGEIDLSLPTLDALHGRFDNNLTFLAPKNRADLSAQLVISAPAEIRVVSSWGGNTIQNVETIKKLVGGMIVLGNYRISQRTVRDHSVVFAARGDYDEELLKQQFVKVLESQCDITGSFPSPRLLGVFQNSVVDCCKGTSLTNGFVVNIPSGTKLDPLNFEVIGTISHELFHQWNAMQVIPADEEGAYLLTEGFTNYFAVAALVRAELIPPERFARFLWRYRKLLENNPRYPGSDFSAMNSGFTSKDDDLSGLAYQKGPFVAVLLDRALREDTAGIESVTSWFRSLMKRYQGSSGYHVDDLRALTVELSGKVDGKALQEFDRAFLGGEALDLDELFSWLGIRCDDQGNCELTPLPLPRAEWRRKLFSAQP